jgi:hypothetical protein
MSNQFSQVILVHTTGANYVFSYRRVPLRLLQANAANDPPRSGKLHSVKPHSKQLLACTPQADKSSSMSLLKKRSAETLFAIDVLLKKTALLELMPPVNS